MPKLVWNGKVEITPKELVLVVWLIWMTAMAWYKLDSLEVAWREHKVVAVADHEALVVVVDHVQDLQKHVSACCDLFAPRKVGTP